MKLVTYIHNEKEEIGYIINDGKEIMPFAEIGIYEKSINELIESYSIEELIKEAREKHTKGSERVISIDEVKLCGAIPKPRQDVICLGINYEAHEKESARYKEGAFEREETYPIYFSKRVNKSLGHGMPINAHLDMVKDLDYEAELGVIIGKRCACVHKEEVEKYIFGYTILNDISAREIQTRHKQWYFGKSLDDFTPMGPCIVTADEISYPPKLNIRSYVNGELRQNSNTKLLINDIGEIIHQLSHGMTLEAGTIISTGTPEGVGMGFQPPKFLKVKDVVECEIEGIGTLRNHIESGQ